MGKRKQGVGTSRITVTVPSDVREQMREIGDRNWSAVAAAAIRSAIEEEHDLEDDTSENDAENASFSVPWAIAMRRQLKQAVADLRQLYPRMRAALFAQPDSYSDAYTRTLHMRYGDDEIEVSMLREPGAAMRRFRFRLGWADEQLATLPGNDLPKLPTDAQSVNEILRIAEDSTVELVNFDDPEPASYIAFFSVPIAASSLNGRSLGETLEKLRLARSEALGFFTGEREKANGCRFLYWKPQDE